MASRCTWKPQSITAGEQSFVTSETASILSQRQTNPQSSLTPIQWLREAYWLYHTPLC